MSKSLIAVIKIALAVATIIFSARFNYSLQVGEMIVPITGQSLAVLCWAVFMRPQESVTAVLIYILIGVYALPVFANESQGMEVLMGPTGGYLVGFLLASLVVSWIRDPYRKENPFSILILMIVGTAIILISGLIRLSVLLGFETSLESGLYNLWQGAVAKILVGTVICYIIHLIVRATQKKEVKENYTV